MIGKGDIIGTSLLPFLPSTVYDSGEGMICIEGQLYLVSRPIKGSLWSMPVRNSVSYVSRSLVALQDVCHASVDKGT